MSSIASPFFVAIVEIEENLADVAAMAGMASGDVRASDSCGHFGAQIVHQFFHELTVGSELSECWNAHVRVRGDKQSNARQFAAKP